MASFRNLSKYSPTVGRCIANNLKDSQTRNVSRCLTCVSNQLNRTASLNDVSLVGTAAVGGGRNRLLREQRAELHLPTSLNPFKGNKRKEYSERRLLGYTMEQMYRVAADVDSYTEFVPWCKQAYTTDHTRGRCKAHMTIGFPPLSENYIANVTTERPNLVKSICKDGRMFDLLATTWKFSPGLAHIPQTCTLDFSVAFEFRSALHSNVAHIFFDEVVRTMVNAFLKRAETIYGPSSIRKQKPRVIAYVS